MLLSLSKRLHSIYLLRCFNDGAAMLLAWGATLLLVRGALFRRRPLEDEQGEEERERKENSRSSSWPLSRRFSLAVSVKMNVLLMAPPVAVLLLQAARALRSPSPGVLVGTALQVLLGLPFFLRFPASYLGQGV